MVGSFSKRSFGREPHIRRAEDNRGYNKHEERGTNNDALTYPISLGLAKEVHREQAEEQVE
jgi:phage-related protein